MINDASFIPIFYKVNPKSRFLASVGCSYSFFSDSAGFSRAIYRQYPWEMVSTIWISTTIIPQIQTYTVAIAEGTYGIKL